MGTSHRRHIAEATEARLNSAAQNRTTKTARDRRLRSHLKVAFPNPSLLLWTTLLLATPRPGTADWPFFRGDAARRGYAALATGDIGAERWRFQTGNAILGGPVVRSDRVFVAGWDGQLRSLDLATGDVVWATPVGAAVSTTPGVFGRRVVVTTIHKHLAAFDLTTGAQRWDRLLGDWSDASPAGASGAVLVSNLRGSIEARSLRDGSVVWRQVPASRVTSSPALGDGIVAVGTLDRELVALERATGALRWTWNAGLGRNVVGSCAIDAGTVFAVVQENGVLNQGQQSLDNGVIALDTDTGSQRWECPFPDLDEMSASSPAVGPDLVVAASMQGYVYGIDREDGTVRWRTRLSDYGIMASPALSADRVYVPSRDGSLYCLDAESGAITAQVALGAPSSSSPAVVAGTLLVGDDAGVVHAFRLAAVPPGTPSHRPRHKVEN